MWYHNIMFMYNLYVYHYEETYLVKVDSYSKITKCACYMMQSLVMKHRLISICASLSTPLTNQILGLTCM